MPKSFFSQGVALLTNGKTTLEDLQATLQKHDFQIVKQLPAAEDWFFSGPSLVVTFLPDVEGLAHIDVVNTPWPDDMDDPDNPKVIAAWSMGHFGPFAYPGGLVRAQQHSWTWEPGRTIANDHRGFIRIRIGYGAKFTPDAYDALAELNFLSRAVIALLHAPGTICYFNPNGEVIRDLSYFQSIWSQSIEMDLAPLPLWSNIRFFSLNEAYGFMDTVGNSQLDIPDIEAIYPKARYDPAAIDQYLRDVTYYVLESGHGQKIENGDPIDGPGETNLSWIAGIPEQGVMLPPRSVLRLCPKDYQTEIQDVLKSMA